MLKDKINCIVSHIYYSIIKKKLNYSSFKKKHVKLFIKYGFFFMKEQNKLYDILKEEYQILDNYDKQENKIIDKKQINAFIKNKRKIKDSFLFVYINGKYNNSLSNNINKNIIISYITSKVEHKIENNFHGKNVITNSYDTFYSLNIILSKNTLYIKIPDNVKLNRPIEILHILTNLNDNLKYMLNYRNFINIGRNSHVNIIENYECIKKHSPYIINFVNKIYSNENSIVNYYKLQDDLENTSIINNEFFVQKKNSKITSFTTSLYAKNIFNYLKCISIGCKTSMNLYAISILSKNQCVNHCTSIKHLYSHSTSNQLYKSVLFEKSKLFFNGKIKIYQNIEQVYSFQKNDNILFSKDSKVQTNPQLSILSKNVKCSHGCTIGNIKDLYVFYLKSRGISDKESKILLFLSFLEELISFINNSEIRILIKDKININLNKFLSSCF